MRLGRIFKNRAQAERAGSCLNQTNIGQQLVAEMANGFNFGGIPICLVQLFTQPNDVNLKRRFAVFDVFSTQVLNQLPVF